jgi:hypothetical protein
MCLCLCVSACVVAPTGVSFSIISPPRRTYCWISIGHLISLLNRHSAWTQPGAYRVDGPPCLTKASVPPQRHGPYWQPAHRFNRVHLPNGLTKHFTCKQRKKNTIDLRTCLTLLHTFSKMQRYNLFCFIFVTNCGLFFLRKLLFVCVCVNYPNFKERIIRPTDI